MKEKPCFSAFSVWNWRVQHFDLPYVAVAWQEIPAALNLTGVQVSFYPAVIKSMDYRLFLYICSSRLVFFSQLRLPWFAFMFWVAMEQELSDGWGCMVRNQANGSEPRRIRITSHIYTAMRKLASEEAEHYSKSKVNAKTDRGTTLLVLSSQ